MSKKIDFEKINKGLDKMVKDLPRFLANEMLNHSKKAFRDEGFTLKAFEPWAKRTTKNKADKATGKRRAILVDSANLKESVLIKQQTFEKVRVGSYGIAYAARHNRGLKGMPKRQFIGNNSEVLNNKLFEITLREFKKATKA